jgi:transcriptional antiterminator NusG
MSEAIEFPEEFDVEAQPVTPVAPLPASEDTHSTELNPEVNREVNPESAPEAVVETAPVPEDRMNWYIIHSYSGFENKVSESLRTRAEAFGFAHKVGQILIPTEEVVELRNGKKVTSKRMVYPGYVLVQLDLDDEMWHAVKNTPRVTGFVGGATHPVPLSADEVNSILYRQSSSADRPRPKMTFEKNENVRIIDGPFANFSGKVDEVNPDRNTLRVLVTIFGRATPVELDFLQVEKA